MPGTRTMIRHKNGSRRRRQNKEGFRWLWRSELGKAYEKDAIEDRADEVKLELRGLCSEPANRTCVDCGTANSKAAWASVNLGVFLCIRCASYHRSLPGHVSRPKCCTMDLWGPDELDRMKRVGNARAVQMYGGSLPGLRPRLEASDQEWKDFLTDKYGEERKFAPKKKNTKQTTPMTASTTARSCSIAVSRAICIELSIFNESQQQQQSQGLTMIRNPGYKQQLHGYTEGSVVPGGGIHQLERDFSWFLGVICEQVGGNRGIAKKKNKRVASKLPVEEKEPMSIELQTQTRASEIQ